MGLAWVWGLARGWREIPSGSDGSRLPGPGKTAHLCGRWLEVGWVRRGRRVSLCLGAHPGISEAAGYHVLPGLPLRSGAVALGGTSPRVGGRVQDEKGCAFWG